MTSAITWVVGGGGLLGGAVTKAISKCDVIWSPPDAVPWQQPHAAETLASMARKFVGDAAGADWQLVWCAGASVTMSTHDDLDVEVGLLRTTLAALDTTRLGHGTVFLASSAGGVYAGSQNPPFTEDTQPAAISPYGHAKLDAEQVVTDWSDQTGVSVIIGRIANLYGPGQNLAKPQGLISQLCRTLLTGQPLSIYVPLDTMRDYLFVDDCAALIHNALHRSRELPAGTKMTKIFASQQGTTIGGLLGEMRRLSRRKPRVVMAASPAAAHQVLDLRLKSVHWSDIDDRTLTPLPVGIGATMEGLRTALRSAPL